MLASKQDYDAEAAPLPLPTTVVMARYDLLESWLIVTFAIYAMAGACWLKVVQLQLRMRSLARAASEHGESLPPAYHRAFRLWFILGWPAFLGMATVFALMVMKPDLW